MFSDGVLALPAEYVKEAVQEDNNNNYDKAYELYKIALEYFSTHLKYEKNPRSKAAITEKVLHMAQTSAHLPVSQAWLRRRILYLIPESCRCTELHTLVAHRMGFLALSLQ